MRTAAELSGRESYRAYLGRKWTTLLVLLIILIAAALFSLSVGSSGMTLRRVIMTVFGDGSKQETAIVWKVRMPRIVTGVVVGMALALSGCIMQNVLRNPLASSSTLGVSQGASFGAAFAIVYLDAGKQVNASTASAISVTDPVAVAVCAFIGGILTTAIILGLSRIARVSPSTMILAGVALSSLFSGATTIVQYFADDIKVASVVYWTFGDLGRAGWRDISIILTASSAGFIYFMLNRWNYNAVESGVQTAKSLGVNVDGLLLISMGICSLITAVSVAFVGTISFIGLIAPHMVRRFVGNDHRFLIPASALMGAVVLVLAELVSRTVVAPSILPIGALTSFLGAPLFLYMIYKKSGIK